MILRLLGVRGIAGIAITAVLVVLLIVQRGETSHWRKQSGQFERLYHDAQTALGATVANYRAAAEQARANDFANAARVRSEQSAISERTDNAYQARLADARARAERLRRAASATNPGNGAGTSVPGLLAAAGGAAQAAGQDRLSNADALTATEQAIQLDELIKWVRQQASVDPATAH